MRITTSLRWLPLLLLSTVVGCSGCGGYDPPRTRGEIAEDQIAIDTIYFTQDGEQFHAPGTTRDMIVDDSGSLAWSAWQCNNPDCPGRGADGNPHLFPLPDPFAYVDENGEPNIRQPDTPADFKLFDEFIDRKCPACLKERNLSSETDEQRQQYQSWLTRHMTPKAKSQLADLEEEMKAYLQRNQPTN